MRFLEMLSRKIFIPSGLVIFVLILVGTDPDPSRPEIGRTLAVGALMALYWITEAIPLAATAFLPILLFPVLGIMKGRDVAPLYFNHIVLLLMGGFIIAGAMQRWNLHKRIALKIILSIGKSPSRLILGFMAGSWLLSMWVSNTATTMMMTPIAIALILKLEENGGEGLRRFEIALLLGIAYAASVGGTATLIGTTPNLVLAEILLVIFPNAPEITFLKWFAFSLPLSFILVTVIYLVLMLLILRRGTFEIETSHLEAEYRAMGKPSYEEKVVLVIFALFALLLMTRADVKIGERVIHGWASLFQDPSFIDDGTVAIGVALLLFFFPARSKAGFVLDWGTVRNLPWDIVVLIGGGFALAGGFHDSGLSAYLGGKLAVLHGFPPIVMVLSICLLITFLTEITSNTATTQVVLPIIGSLSIALGVNPLLLMVPATISASCAFMLPVATPPNAIIFGTHRLRATDMARVGIYLNIIGAVVITLLLLILGKIVYGIDLGMMPDWAGK
ncbi:MAG: DASS family sodium-coupled anion symporter [Candidatus Latescibacteria bacterium]|nr:DASS family sodium-coupled anion symporter [Candidatus Latescibacterota bacterium]NIM66275.1 DASS family sodium-coupled anion symporter [Candidatus Latescibacterota bacterium]NIO02756.1 DASS family sodium-coupled anion symporter [Candidatus Latescibacterota bacterium]NIO29891.1 DASS family sodium-coupled anion symporter [Candidatus Latescibacterota bacterium]NIO57505.1 DASS family sodium-coupled anion symporter [Candidatus Latescibacterota bacterium]